MRLIDANAFLKDLEAEGADIYGENGGWWSTNGWHDDSSYSLDLIKQALDRQPTIEVGGPWNCWPDKSPAFGERVLVVTETGRIYEWAFERIMNHTFWENINGEKERDTVKYWASIPGGATLGSWGQREWFKVSDQQPAIGEPVLFCDGGAFFGIGIGWLQETYDGIFWRTMEGKKFRLEAMSHWMPLPDHPNDNAAAEEQTDK